MRCFQKHWQTSATTALLYSGAPQYQSSNLRVHLSTQALTVLFLKTASLSGQNEYVRIKSNFSFVSNANLQTDNSTVAMSAHSTDNIVSIFYIRGPKKKREINISLSEWINRYLVIIIRFSYQMCLHQNNRLAGTKTIPLSA